LSRKINARSHDLRGFGKGVGGCGDGMQQCTAKVIKLVFATCRRGTVAQANLRIPAGIGVVAAFILLGGPSAAVAIADQGGSHGGHSNNGKGSNSGVHGGSDWSDDNIPKNSTGDGGPWSKVGSGRSPNLPGQQFKPPKVTFGDGRTPGIQDHDPGPRWGGNAPEPAPPPPPPPPPPVFAPTPAPAGHVHDPRVIQQLVVAPTAALHDPFFGLAGLLLIPAAGAILGYRQARAAQHADKLGRS
jgi:hypothetical protein